MADIKLNKNDIIQMQELKEVLNHYNELNDYNIEVKNELIEKLFQRNSLKTVCKTDFYKTRRILKKIIKEGNYSGKLVRTIENIQYPEIFKICSLNTLYFGSLDEIFEYSYCIDKLRLVTTKTRMYICLLAILYWFRFSLEDILAIDRSCLFVNEMKIKVNGREFVIPENKQMLFLSDMLKVKEEDEIKRVPSNIRKNIRIFNLFILENDFDLKPFSEKAIKESSEFERIFQILKSSKIPFERNKICPIIEKVNPSHIKDYQYIDRFLCWAEKYKKI